MGQWDANLGVCVVQEQQFKAANRIFFLSIPPGVFVDAARGAADAASSECGPQPPCPPTPWVALHPFS